MFRSICLGMLLVSLSAHVHAKSLIGTIDKFINIHSGEVIEVASNEISDDGLNATYFDYLLGKKIEINMVDYSKATNKEIANVKSGEMILVKINRNFDPCEVWYVFENQMAKIACKTDRIQKNIGVDRPIRAQYTLKNVDSEFVIPEISEKDGFKKHEFAKLSDGQKIRIEAIFENGEVLVEKMNLSFFDTSSILSKYNIIRTNLTELNKN